MTIEKRQFERIPQKVQLKLTPLVDSDRAVVENAVSKDISENGLCLTSTIRYKIGSLLRVEIGLEGWQLFLQTVLKRKSGTEIKPLTAVGKVVWSQKHPGSSYIQTGVQFIEIDADDFAAFKKYLHIIRESVRDES